jgi:small subunit ribosomal protein S6
LKKYEAVFILEIRKVEDEGKNFSEEFARLIESFGGKMIKSESLGRKQFAHEIKKRKAGAYWNYIFELPAEKAPEVKNKFRLDERVLRTLIINYDRPETEKVEVAETT